MTGACTHWRRWTSSRPARSIRTVAASSRWFDSISSSTPRWMSTWWRSTCRPTWAPNTLPEIDFSTNKSSTIYWDWWEWQDRVNLYCIVFEKIFVIFEILLIAYELVHNYFIKFLDVLLKHLLLILNDNITVKDGYGILLYCLFTL